MTKASWRLALLNPLIDISKKAAEILMQVYKDDSYIIDFKEDSSPVTSADLMVNAYLCKELELLTPEIPIISEENMEMPYQQRKEFNKFWLLDPLDGTKQFINKTDDFSINIALVEDQRATLGIVVVPVYQEIYYAALGYGSFMEKKDMTCRLHCRSYDLEQHGLTILSSKSYINQDTKHYIAAHYTNPILESRGSALKFMMLANALADEYPRLAPTMEWDTAAPQIILEEAGGTIINYDTQKSMTYNKESLVNPGFIAQSSRKIKL